MLASRKGFLGPIGDDLPSLIPLSFALIMFFVSFSFALSQYTQKSAAFSEDLEAVRIASTIRSNNYISSFEQFQSLCDSVRLASTNLRFEAGIVSIDPKLGDPFKLDATEDPNDLFLSDGGNHFYCTNLPAGERLNEDIINSRTVLTKVYPVVLEQTERHIVVPVQLVVMVWKA